MKKTKAKSTANLPSYQQANTLKDYAHAVIEQQYRAMVKQEKKVLADRDPEHLHHMRVSSRRLRTALHVFSVAVQLPKAANEQRIGSIAKTLGALRDLDVQIADLSKHYRPLLPKVEQASLDSVLADLKQERRRAFAAVEATLTQSRYKDLKNAYETWLDRPQCTPLADLPLLPLVPDLLSPLLASLLLHPAWLITLPVKSDREMETLHELRKACKHVRYQAEFFEPVYGDRFSNWVEEIKTIQANLGRVQDSQVLQELLAEHLPNRTKLPNLNQAIQHTEVGALADWDALRQKYLDADFRSALRHLIMEPALPNACTEPVGHSQQSQPSEMAVNA